MQEIESTHSFLIHVIKQYLRQIEFNHKINFSDLIKSICYDSNIKYFYLVFEIGEGVIKVLFFNSYNPHLYSTFPHRDEGEEPHFSSRIQA